MTSTYQADSDRPSQRRWNRVLLKLSGEQLEGSRGHGIDPEFAEWLAREIKTAQDETGAEFVIVIGGGNIMRGASIAGEVINRVAGDHMGMLATLINGVAVYHTLQSIGVDNVRLQTRLRCEDVAETYFMNTALDYLSKGNLLIIAGGTGNPLFTTDTAAVSAALELDCDVVLKATKVDGVYDRHPDEDGATKFQKTTHQEALVNDNIKVMDDAAIAMAKEHKLPIIVFKLEEHSILKVIRGERIGTLVK